MRRKLINTTFLASFIWTAGIILTQGTLRAADTIVYAIRIGDQALGTLDLNTGVYTQISTQAISEYQLGVFGGVLYGAGGCGCLIQINPSTGAVTASPIPFSHGGNNFGALNGFGSTTDGLFAVGAGAGGLNALYSIDPTTGLETLIGSTGITTGGGSGFLSASNDSGKLYWEIQTNFVDTLYSLNTSTGAATLIGSEMEGFPSKTGNPYSMVFTGGTLWANFYSFGFGTIDTANGHQTLVSTGAFNAFFGMAPFPLTAPPALNSGSVANGATYVAGGLVPGSWALVKGSNLSTVSRIWADADFVGLGNNLPTNLSGVQVKVNNLPAAIYYIDQGQISFQVPNGVSGTASLQVINNGVASNIVTGTAVNSAPGILPLIVNGTNYPLGQFLDGKLAGDPSLGSGFRKAKPGENLQLYVTGLVPTPAGVLITPQGVSGVTVTVGAMTVNAPFAGLIAVGEFYINFNVPNLPDGTYPITISVNGVSSPATINSNPPGPLVLPIQN